MIKTYYILPFAMALVSCGGSHADEPSPVTPTTPEAEYAMAFTPERSEAESRSTADDVAKALGYRFAVFGWKTNAGGAKEYVLAKDPAGKTPYIVSYTTAQGWDYAAPDDQFLKYWDLSAKSYGFYALANYTGSKADDLSVSFSNDGTVAITNIDVSDPKAAGLMDSHYLRVCSPESGDINDYDIWEHPELWKVPFALGDAANNPTVNNPLADIPVYYRPAAQDDVPAYADIVPLPFHYLLSQVQFKIYNQAPQHGPSIPISHVTIKIYGSAGYYTTGNYIDNVFENTGAQSQVFVDDDLTDAYIHSSKNNALTLYSGIMLPQTLDNIKARVTITTDDGMISGTVDLGDSWERGKLYIYYLYTEYTEDYILVDTVEIDDWLPGKSKEVIQTNW